MFAVTRDLNNTFTPTESLSRQLHAQVCIEHPAVSVMFGVIVAIVLGLIRSYRPPQHLRMLAVTAGMPLLPRCHGYNYESAPFFSVSLKQKLAACVEGHTLSVVLLFSLAMTVFVFSIRCHRRKHVGFPTGPVALPCFGNLLTLGRMPHLALQNMGRKYGPVFRVMMGSTPMVIVTDYKMIRESFNKPVFSGRPNMFLVRAIYDGAGKSAFFIVYKVTFVLNCMF